MIEPVRSWLLAVVAVSLLCALADAMMPNGAVRRVGRLVCGLVLLLAVLSPLAQADVSSSQRWLEGWLAAGRDRETELREEVDRQMKVIIEQEYAAYIVDKAAELGLTCAVRVECGAPEAGVYLPIRAEVRGRLSGGGKEQLVQILTEDLGIPEPGQIYIEEELP